jgi:agmatine deiminase
MASVRPPTATPALGGFRMPAEWAPHRATWTAWPCHAYAWGDALAGAQREFTALLGALCDGGEVIELLVADAAVEAEARAALAALPVQPNYRRIAYGDIWLRDIGPIFLSGELGLAGLRAGFNGWGGKFRYPNDAQVATVVLTHRGVPRYEFPFVMEGGALEVDGEGTLLTTRSCLLNDNRNPGKSEAEISAQLCQDLGVTKVLWLDDGLLNDHTDGHIDNIARFVAPGVVVCMEPVYADDPHAERLLRIRRMLLQMTDAAGRKLEVRTLPSPGRVLGGEGEPMPASYCNYYLTNTTLVVPAYGVPEDAIAAGILSRCFPELRVVSLSSRSLLEGGGSFHCITQQEPLVRGGAG